MNTGMYWLGVLALTVGATIGISGLAEASAAKQVEAAIVAPTTGGRGTTFSFSASGFLGDDDEGDDGFSPTPAGTQYCNSLTIGVPGWLGRLANPLIRHYLFKPARGRAWIKHNIEEAGNFEKRSAISSRSCPSCTWSRWSTRTHSDQSRDLAVDRLTTLTRLLLCRARTA